MDQLFKNAEFNYPIDSPHGIIHKIYDINKCRTRYSGDVYSVVMDLEEVDYSEFSNGDELLEYLRSPIMFIAKHPEKKTFRDKRTIHGVGPKILLNSITGSGNNQWPTEWN